MRIHIIIIAYGGHLTNSPVISISSIEEAAGIIEFLRIRKFILNSFWAHPIQIVTKIQIIHFQSMQVINFDWVGLILIDVDFN